jgi:hypothetical protein
MYDNPTGCYNIPITDGADVDEASGVKISITGKLTYHDEISVGQAAQIIAFIDASSGSGLTVPATAMRPAAPSLQLAARIATTPREALDNSGARTNPEKLLAFAALVLQEGKETFTLEDIRPLFRRARETAPKNLSRDFDVVVRSGWADGADTKGEYYITKQGMAALEAGFAKDSPPRKQGASSSRPRSVAPRKARKKAEVPEVFQGVDPIPNSLEGLPSYNNLKQRKDQFLWVLKLAKSLGVDGLTNQEIVWVTDHLGSGIAGNNINSAYTTARKAGHANRSTITNKIRITLQGEEALAGLGAVKS